MRYLLICSGVFLLDDNTGPVLCEDTGLNLEALNPSYIRISTEKSVTFTCTVVGAIPATLSWYKNGVVGTFKSIQRDPFHSFIHLYTS